MPKLYDALRRSGTDVNELAGGTNRPTAGSSASEPVPSRIEQTPVSRALLNECVNLYYGIEALKSFQSPLILQFIASRPGEGTSTIARHFAQVAVQEAGQSVLLVNCDWRAGQSARGGKARRLLDVVDGSVDLNDVVTGTGKFFTADLADKKNALMDLEVPRLLELFDRIKDRFSLTIFDSPAALSSPESVAMSRHCDGVVLVIEAETTRAALVKTTKQNLEKFGGQILGVVLNKRQFYIPRWAYRLL